MTGIIDIGSNTIRLIMYEKRKRISNSVVNSEIIKDTKDGFLSEEGIEKLCNILLKFKKEAKDNEVYAFGTYAMRVLKNREEVKKVIFDKTGILIDILSGEEEANYGYLGLRENIKKKSEGIGIDLGGGSAQITVFDKEKVIFSKSYPIGSKQIKNKFVKNVFLTDEEIKEVGSYIEKELFDIDRNIFSGKKLYMMGGTAKTAVKIYKFISSTENPNVIETEKIDFLIKFIKENEFMKGILKSRYDNIICGLFIMKKLAQITGAKKIHIMTCGVRDGYLINAAKV